VAAGRRDDDHRECAHGIPAHAPRQRRHHEGEGQEETGVTVGHADEGRTLRLRLLDEPDEGRVRALGGRTLGSDVERRAAAGDAPGGDGREQRLARQRARVDDGFLAGDGAVHRDDLPRPHDDDVARPDPLDRHLLEGAVATKLRHPRRTLHECGQLTARATRGRRLERGSAGEHQTDDDPGQLLAQGERADHRHERDRVDAEVMADGDGANDLVREVRREHAHCDRPDEVAHMAFADQVQQSTDSDCDDGDACEHARPVFEVAGPAATGGPRRGCRPGGVEPARRVLEHPATVPRRPRHGTSTVDAAPIRRRTRRGWG
jgi:hypothetical protein